MPERTRRIGPDSLSAIAFVLASAYGCSCGTGPDGGADDGSMMMREDVPFMRPPYTSMAVTCGFTSPALCQNFEDGPAAGGRSGELDPAVWSVVRGTPGTSGSFEEAVRVRPALIGECRDDLSNVRVLPDSDVLVCDQVPTIGSRHVLATAAAQNYGLSTYRGRARIA